MRKLIVSIHSTANDVVGGPAPDETELVWAQANIEDATGPLLETMATVDTILLGRGTYEDLVRRWPKVAEWPDVSEVGSRLGEKINTTQKLVVAGDRTSDVLEWGAFDPAIRLAGPDVEGQVRALKEGDGGDIITFGSPTLVQSLTNAGLVDEYHVIVHPVVMNEGKRLFENLDGRTDFRLLSADVYEHGALLVKYAVTRT